MDVEQIRKFCLSMPYATEKVQWGNDLVFKIGEKMFAVVGLSLFKIGEKMFAVVVSIRSMKPRCRSSARLRSLRNWLSRKESSRALCCAVSLGCPPEP